MQQLHFQGWVRKLRGLLKEKWSSPQKKCEVSIKSLDGKLMLMLVPFDEEGSVHDLHIRVAKQVDVSKKQFLLVFQSRTLKATQKLAEVVTQPGVTFCMQGLMKEGMMGQGLMGEWDCPACGAEKVWPSRAHCFWCGFNRDGTGCIAAVLNHFPQFACQQTFAQNQNGNFRGTDNGMERTQRNQSAAPRHMSPRGLKNRQEEQKPPETEPMYLLTQVLQLLQNLLLDPQVKEHLHVSLRGHVEPCFSPKNLLLN